MNRFLIAAVLVLANLAACSPSPAATAPAPAATAVPPAQASGTIAGTIAETINSGGYTYALLRTGAQDAWIAANEIPVKAGDRISATIDMPMENFTSKTLNRSFPLIYFVKGVTSNGEAISATAGTLALVGSHEPTQTAQGPVAVEPIKPVPGGITIGDLWSRRKALSNTTVTVSGKVVKVNNDILGSNWLHLQDGSGSAKDGTHDLTITTSAVVKVGDIVTVSGKLSTDKDLGSGYAYAVIIENATVTRATAANN